VESSDDLHEADSPVEERPQPHGNWARGHEPGDITPRPLLRGFALTEKVLATLPSRLPSHHSAASVLPTAAVSVPPCVPAPIIPALALAPAPAPTVPGLRVGTSLLRLGHLSP